MCAWLTIILFIYAFSTTCGERGSLTATAWAFADGWILEIEMEMEMEIKIEMKNVINNAEYCGIFMALAKIS